MQYIEKYSLQLHIYDTIIDNYSSDLCVTLVLKDPFPFHIFSVLSKAALIPAFIVT